MSFLKSIPADPGLLQIFQAFPESARPLLEYHQVLLRGESPFSAAERELIAAYVSGCIRSSGETAPAARAARKSIVVRTLTSKKNQR